MSASTAQPASLSRPKRASVADTMSKIAGSLQAEDRKIEETPSKKSQEEDGGGGKKKSRDEEWSAAPAGKKPKVGKKAALAAAPAADVAALKTSEVKKRLNAHVKTCARMVDADWHDGYEEQGEECMEWIGACVEVAGSALRVCVACGCGFDLGHEALKIVADTWAQLEKIPFRCDPGECISEGSWQDGSKLSLDLGGDEAVEHTCSSADELLRLTWPLLLGAAAASEATTDAALLQMIKDAVDNGVDAPHKASEEEAELIDAGLAVPAAMAAGRARLAELVVGRKTEWQKLASTKKQHKQRRAIDRRFSGPKNRRTRDYDSEGEGCVIS